MNLDKFSDWLFDQGAALILAIIFIAILLYAIKVIVNRITKHIDSITSNNLNLIEALNKERETRIKLLEDHIKEIDQERELLRVEAENCRRDRENIRNQMRILEEKNRELMAEINKLKKQQ